MTEKTPFAIGTFAVAGGPAYPGLVLDDHVHDLRALLGDPALTTTALLARWDLLQDHADRLAGAAVVGVPVAELTVRAPVEIGSIFAAGANYREHVLQMAVAHKLGTSGLDDDAMRAEAAREIDERAAHGDPYVWTGAASAVCGPYDDVVLPAVGTNHDWELELGLVIGREAYQVDREHALDHVAGYLICNDLTTRSLIPRTDIPMMGTDWLRAKNSPTFYPCGPYLVPSRFVPDPLDLQITLRLNGDTMQDGSTKDMLFGPAAIISFVSRHVRLRPGDLVLTGSPAGNGSHHGRFLQPGDVMESEITGLGVQRNRCVESA